MGPSDPWGYWVWVARIWSSQLQGLTLQATDSLNSQSRACQNCALARWCSTIYGMFLIHYEDLMCSSWFLLWLRCTFSLLPNPGRCLGRGICPLFITLAPAPVCVNRHLQINQHSSHLNFWFVFRCSSMLGRQCSWTTLLAQCGVKHCGSGQLQFFTMLTPDSNGRWTVDDLWNDLNKSHEGPSWFASGLFA